MSAARALTLAALAVLGGATARGQAAAPVVFYSGAGRFEVVAGDAAAARTVVAEAEAAWRVLGAPLALPAAGFTSPIFARVLASQDWAELAVFRVRVEPGGIVSLRLPRASALQPTILRRALVQALLLRLAVARHGLSPNLAAPLWLEHACTGWWATREEPARLDALRQETMGRAPPALADLLNWERGPEEPAERVAASGWLLAFFQAESAVGAEWDALLGRLLAGEAGEPAVAAVFGGKFSDAAERELWWRTGWHHHTRARTVPTLDAAESRAALAAAARFVFARDGRDEGLDWAALRAARAEAAVSAATRERARRVEGGVAGWHPFYRNAGLSLALALRAVGAAGEREFAAARAQFEADWRDGEELEREMNRALDGPAP